MKKYLKREVIFGVVLALLVLIIVLFFILGRGVKRIGPSKVLLIEKEGTTQKLTNLIKNNTTEHVANRAITSVNIYVYRRTTKHDKNFVNIAGTYDIKNEDGKSYFYYLGFEKNYSEVSKMKFSVKNYEVIDYKYNKKEMFIIKEEAISVSYEIEDKTLMFTLDSFIYEDSSITFEPMDEVILRRNFPNLYKFVNTLASGKASNSFYAKLYGLEDIKTDTQTYLFVDRLSVQRKRLFKNND